MNFEETDLHVFIIEPRIISGFNDDYVSIYLSKDRIWWTAFSDQTSSGSRSYPLYLMSIYNKHSMTNWEMVRQYIINNLLTIPAPPPPVNVLYCRFKDLDLD